MSEPEYSFRVNQYLTPDEMCEKTGCEEAAFFRVEILHQGEGIPKTDTWLCGPHLAQAVHILVPEDYDPLTGDDESLMGRYKPQIDAVLFRIYSAENKEDLMESCADLGKLFFKMGKLSIQLKREEIVI